MGVSDRSLGGLTKGNQYQSRNSPGPCHTWTQNRVEKQSWYYFVFVWDKLPLKMAVSLCWLCVMWTRLHSAFASKAISGELCMMLSWCGSYHSLLMVRISLSLAQCPSPWYLPTKQSPRGSFIWALSGTKTWVESRGQMWLLGMEQHHWFASVWPGSGRLGCAGFTQGFECLHSHFVNEQCDLLQFSSFLLCWGLTTRMEA